MTKSRWFLTPGFLENIRTHGEICKASAMLSTDLTQYEGMPKMSTWALICEEMVDTSHEIEHWLRVAAELKRRGIYGKELEEMRMFAWRTAGWLNFEKCLWNWIGLDGEDIRKALVYQFQTNEITEKELCQSLEFLSKYE
jgi:hypothetical protein